MNEYLNKPKWYVKYLVAKKNLKKDNAICGCVYCNLLILSFGPLILNLGSLNKFFRFLHLWFLQGLPLSVLVVIGSLTFSDWCQRLPGWPGPQPSTLLWKGHCLSKHEAFSSSISTNFKIHCTFYWILHRSFGWPLSFVWRAPKRKCCHARKHSTSNGLLVIIFMNFANVLQIFFKYLQCLHLSLLHCKDKLSCPVNTPCRNCAITHL